MNFNLTKEQQEMLRKLEQSLNAGGSRHSPRRQSWADSVKKFFDDIGSS